MSVMTDIMRYWISVIGVLITASLASAGEYCTYTYENHHQLYVRTSYCEGYCCEENDTRCCENDYTGLFIGCIIAGCVFLIVVIMVIAVLCKRSANMKRARIQNQQAQNIQVAGVPQCHGHPNIFLIQPTQPPPYSKNNNSQFPAAPPPPYPGTPGRGGANNITGAHGSSGPGQMGGFSGDGQMGGFSGAGQMGGFSGDGQMGGYSGGGPIGGFPGTPQNSDQDSSMPPLYQRDEKPSYPPPAYYKE